MINLDLAIHERDGCVIVVMSGELDILDGQSVTAALVGAAAGGLPVIVDMAGLRFIDCRGARSLGRALTEVRHIGGDLLLAAPQRLVLRVLRYCGLNRALSVAASVDEAVLTAGCPPQVLMQTT